MVFQKSLDYGSIGYQIPKMPRFPRSVRGKPLPSKKVEVNQMRPFDMLATVAEDLLGKKDNDSPLFGTTEITAPISTVKQEQFDNGSPSKSDIFDQGSCDESIFVSRCDSQCLIPFNFEEKTATSVLALAKCDGTGPDAGIHSLEDPVEIDTKATALVSSDSSVEISPIGDRGNAGNIELLVDRDDDENSSGRSNCRNIYTMPIKSHCTGDGRVRKMMASNSWNASQEARKGELWNDGEVKHVFHSRKLCYTRQRTKRSSFKRRKLSERCSFSASNGAFCSKGASDSLGKDAHGRSSSKLGHVSYESVDNHVKLSIKSFRVPEIFIEIPTNATVGSLKRTVLEAVTAILSGGLRVGVLLQGKKIRDDNKTILQAGISNVDKLATLGFTLEPNPTQAHHNSRFCEPESLTKFHAPTPGLDHGTPNAPDVREYCTESVHDLVHSPTNPLSSVDNDNSKALIPVLSVNPEVLTIVPFSNSKRSEMVQRRIRRPFSVSEVEALVVAVEKLGTGRWRDVKLRAFDGAKHRTYVDLKDKWKTLVHTARISPQQRRGEPVPQALLDRVLSTHDYWSRQQAKSACLAEQCLRSAQA